MSPPLVSVAELSEPRPGADAVTWLSVYLVLLYAVPSRLVIGPLGSAGSVSMVAGLVSLGMWFLSRIGAGSRTPMQTHPVRLVMVAFACSVLVSYTLAMSRPINADEISPADVALVSLASWSGTMLVSHDGIASRARLDTMVQRLAWAGGLMALLGIVQFVLKRPLVDAISIPGLTELFQPQAFERNGLTRPAGTATHPIEYGALLSMLLPLALHVGFRGSGTRRLLRWLPAAAITVMVALSSTRTTYLSAAVAAVICAISWTRRERLAVLGVLLSAAAALVVSVPRLARSVSQLFLGAGDDPSITSRTSSFDMAWAYLTNSPLFGRGLGTFLPKYRIFDNQYLLLLVTVGIVGTIAFTALAVTAVIVLIRRRSHLSRPADRDLAIALIAAVSSGFLSLAFFDAFAFPMTMGALFLLLGLVGAFNRLVPLDEQLDPPRAEQREPREPGRR